MTKNIRAARVSMPSQLRPVTPDEIVKLSLSENPTESISEEGADGF